MATNCSLGFRNREIRELKLTNGNGEAERFYRSLEGPVLVGLEACGNTHWFEDMLERLGHEVWIGDAAAIRASYMRKQKTDKRDAAHILKLLMEERFPRLWRPSKAERDLRQLLIHRHRLVGVRTRVKNGLHHLMLNKGIQMKRKLWSEAGQKILQELPLEGWAAQRRKDLLQLLRTLNPQIAELDQAVDELPMQRAGTLVDDAAWCRSDHLAGVCDHHGGCETIRQGQTGGELPGSDSERAQFKQASSARIDQQARESVSADAAGRERANGMPSR